MLRLLGELRIGPIYGLASNLTHLTRYGDRCRTFGAPLVGPADEPSTMNWHAECGRRATQAHDGMEAARKSSGGGGCLLTVRVGDKN